MDILQLCVVIFHFDFSILNLIIFRKKRKGDVRLSVFSFKIKT